MAEHQRGGDRQVAMLEMQVRAADPAIVDGDDRASRRRSGNREFRDVQRRTEAAENRRPAFEPGDGRVHALSGTSARSSTDSGDVTGQMM